MDWIVAQYFHQLFSLVGVGDGFGLVGRKMVDGGGKHKPSFSAHVDCGDNVIVINADKIRLTGKKWTDKLYIRHTGYPGGQRKQTSKELYQKSSTLLIESAVRGMLPRNRLGRQLFKNLYAYVGTEHPHEAQKPKEVKI